MGMSYDQAREQVEILLQRHLAKEVNTATPADYRPLLAKIAEVGDAVWRELLVKELARKLKVQAAVLRKELAKLKATADSQGVVVEDVNPWPEPVDGRAVLAEIETIIERHVRVAPEQRVAVALWIVLTYCFDAFHVLPLLAITSPEKRCGKTTLLSLLSRLVNRPLPASNVTPAATFRVIEELRPTLLIDEGDSFLRENDELSGILNSGHARDTAFVVRVNPQTYRLERFSTWAPKAIALIGELPPTLSDRAILIRLTRKLPQEKVERLPLVTPAEWRALQCKLRRWAEDHLASLQERSVEIPLLNDRAGDNWGTLLAIAEEVGGDWPHKAKEAALILEKDGKGEDSLKVQLLADLREVFSDEPSLFTNEILERLLALEDRPWREFRNGRPLNAHALSRLLRPFGITPTNIRQGEVVKKGYRAEDLKPIWARYLPHPPSAESATSLHPNAFGDLRGTESATEAASVAVRDVKKSAPLCESSGVADNKGEGGKEEDLPSGLPLWR